MFIDAHQAVIVLRHMSTVVLQGCIDSAKLAPLPLLKLSMEVNDNQKSPKVKPRL